MGRRLQATACRSLRHGIQLIVPRDRSQLINKHNIQGSFRSFSSNAPSNSPDVPLFKSILNAVDDRARLNEWDQKGYLDPHMPHIKKLMIFLFFHRYFGTRVFDLPDFLDGAQVALELVLHTMHTADFFSAASNNEQKNISEAYKTIKLLENIMSTECLESILEKIKEYHDDGYTSVSLTQLDIHDCVLSDVGLSEDLLQLRMDVVYSITQYQKFEGIKGEQNKTDHKELLYQLRFQTELKDLTQLDWSIVSMWEE